MKNKTYKSIIQKYVILKIQSGEWKAGERIPSENGLALKFGCSRLTIRHSLQSLVHSGVLHVKKGSGYVIPSSGPNDSLVPFTQSKKTIKSHVVPIDIPYMKQIFNLDKNQRVISIKKVYEDTKGQLAIQITLLNKDLIWEYDKDIVEESITKFLSLQGVTIKYSNITIKQCEKSWRDIKYFANQLGWKHEPFVEIIRTYSKSDWIEKTIRVTRPNEFKFKFTKVNFS